MNALADSDPEVLYMYSDQQTMRPDLSDDVRMSKASATPVFTFEDLRNLSLSARIASSISLAVCAVVILTAAWIYTTPSARHHLDRISFRLLLCVMVLEIGYDSAWIALFHAWPVYTPSEVACSIGMFSLFGTMASINYLCACIAINLCLTIVFNVNPKKWFLERWYVGLSMLFGFGVILVPTILGHFGKNTSRGGSNSFCWFKQVQDPKQKIVRYFVDFYVWQCLSALVATIFVALLVFKLWRRGREGSRLALAGLTFEVQNDSQGASTSQRRLEGTDPNGHEAPTQWTTLDPFASSSSTASTSAAPDEKVDPGHPADPILSAVRRLSMRFGSLGTSEAESQCTQVGSLNQLHSKLLGVILRVCAYPVALIIVNILHTVPDIYLVTHGGVKSPTDWRLYCIFTFLYGGRGLVFSLLMIFVDPCLRKGARAAWNARRWKRTSLRSNESGSDSTFDLGSPHLDRDGHQHQHEDPIMALASPTSEGGDDLDIFQFFARGPGRESIATTITDSETRSKSVVTIDAASIKPCTSPRIVKRKLPKVEEEGEQDIWFSKVESLL